MKKLFLFLALGALVVLLSPAALAQSPGYDQFQTGAGTSFDLGPGIGVVNFQGVPIQSSSGNADTIIQRTGGTGGQFNLSVYALFLKSTQPITFNNQSADVYATINNTGGAVSTSTLPQPDALSGSTGTLTITSSNSSGGTFDSSLSVNADLIFVKAGTSVTNPANYIGHKPGPTKTLVATGNSWSTTAPSGYPTCLASGGFYVYQISGASHLHVVQAAVRQGCSGPATHQPGTGSTPEALQKCVCAVTLQ
jgi:hypothetical protein